MKKKTHAHGRLTTCLLTKTSLISILSTLPFLKIYKKTNLLEGKESTKREEKYLSLKHPKPNLNQTFHEIRRHPSLHKNPKKENYINFMF